MSASITPNGCFMRRTILASLEAAWMAILIAILAPIMPALGQPGIEGEMRRREYCDNHEIECADAATLHEFRRHYSSRARIRLEPEQRLPNGVAWRLFTDAITGLTLPRITWMRDRQALLKANRLFDAIHGSLLRSAGHLIQRSDVALTYATAGYAGYVETYSSEDRWYVLRAFVVGHILDLKAGKVFSVQPCPTKVDVTSSEYGFVFGDLLEVCDFETAERFYALWDDNMAAAAQKAEDTGDNQSLACLKAMEDRPHPRKEVSIVLTSTGLAAYHTSYFVEWMQNCVLRRNILNPTIIPYRELESLMKPGPLKDDLLSRAIPTR